MTSFKYAAPFIFLTTILSIILLIFAGLIFSKIDLDSFWSYPSPTLGSMRISPIDGMTMVYVPEGEFLMGDTRSEDSSPPHLVYLDAYWIDQTDVTNDMYARCVQAGKCSFHVQQASTDIHFDEPTYANDPVVYISWFEAAEYCQWARRRLPTEAEWEKAARGVNKRLYPWGNSSPESSLLNFDNFIGDTTPVDTYLLGASPYGALDMAGNVRQWVADWYGLNYYQDSTRKNPIGPISGEMRVLRGGSFIDNFQRVRATNRFKHIPDSAGVNRGFRCAVYAWDFPGE